MKLLVIVPYRDRESHLKEFIPYITTTLKNQNIENKIVVVEQSPEKLFNRGLLCNIGFELYKNECDYICIHDVDIIGENFDYSYELIATHLSARWRGYNYKEFYQRCLGGVVLFPKNDFIKINGFSNEYWGWGAEDDDLRLRCDIMNVTVQRKQGKFYSLPHERIEWKNRIKETPGFDKNLKRFRHVQKMSIEEKIQDILKSGLSNIDKFFIVGEIVENNNYTLIRAIV
jgi:hypothetical protein